MKRLWPIWAAFAAGAAVVVGAMAWISVLALRMDRVEARANRRAAFEERTRLALWRMDSALTPLITREGARPYFAYTAFHPVDRAYTRMFAEIRPDEVLVPSPLLAFRSPYVLLHFQYDPAGELSSPQVPAGNQRDLAEIGYVAHEQIERAAAQLARLKSLVARAALLALLPAGEPRIAEQVAIPSNSLLPRRGGRDQGQLQHVFNTLEFQQRSVSAQNAAVPVGRQEPPAIAADVSEGAVRAVRVGEELLLARRVRIGEGEYVQGLWLNWPNVRCWLLEGVADLLPGADLAPAEDGGEGGDRRTYRLAALPVRLLAGAVPPEGTPAYSSPLRMSLAIAWACVLGGATAVALVLRGAVALSHRRGAFVSAVTHELRTPLTTFRLYADLLAEGMVTGEAKRAQYLTGLQEQSERLSHLVENVLAYARLSRGRRHDRLEAVTLGELIARPAERLANMALRAGMKLIVHDDPAADLRVLADAAVVEQVLVNLVDNACKYGRGGEPTMELALARQGRFGLISLRDHGPGVAPALARRLFRPFSKSARQAAGSAPGVGLGLAISRRLARDMGGDLRLDLTATGGARFVLSLRLEGPR